MYTLVLLCRRRGLANFRQPVLSFAEAEDVAGSKWRRYAKLLKLDKCNLVHHALARRHIGTRRRHGGEAGCSVVQRETSNGLRAAEAAFGGAGLCSRRFYAKILRVRANFLRF